MPGRPRSKVAESSDDDEAAPASSAPKSRNVKKEKEASSRARRASTRESAPVVAEMPDASIHLNPEFLPVHRLFLHCWLSIRFETEERAMRLFEHCCRKFDVEFAPEDFNDFVGIINTSLLPLGMTMASIRSPKEGDKGSRYWALINTSADESAQLATGLATNELTFFQRIISLIMNGRDDSFEIPTSYALRESSNAAVKPSLTKIAAEGVIGDLVTEGWLVNRDGQLSLSLRAQLELKEYLTEEFEDSVQKCSLCKEIAMTHCQSCNSANCPGRLHEYCAKVYFNSHSSVCPEAGCGAAWGGSGQRERPRRQERGNRSSPTSSSRQSQEKDDEEQEQEQEQQEEEEEEQEEEAEEDQGAPESSPPKKGRGIRRSSAASSKRKR
ncbi:Non-structural maintenance of chromosomes element 1 [Irineochytrium annulatum]|nr:Non-structural maintenance of chromosomes element 1 [Irineochytrium annulatum]